jgi:hypothetical protein
MALATFGSQEDANKATNLQINESCIIEMQAVSPRDTIEIKSRTIRVWDIPLGTTTPELKTVMDKYGKINKISMSTAGMWQNARVEYSTTEEHDKLAQRWAIPFKADLIRIFPFLRTNEIKQQRDAYTLKLTNLPPGTTGFDLKQIIDDTHARTCYIPRNQNYQRKRIAILSFKDEVTQDRAREYDPVLGNTPLYWHEDTEKLCYICHSAEHLAAECPVKEKFQEKRQQFATTTQRFGYLYQRYKPPGTNKFQSAFQQRAQSSKNALDRTLAHNKFQQTVNQFRNRGSFAKVAAQRKRPPSTVFQVQNNAHQLKADAKIAEVVTTLQQVAKELAEIKKTIDSMTTRMEYLEDFAYFSCRDDEQAQADLVQNKADYIDFISRQQTPPPSHEIEQEGFNYQRKRQATSPIVEARAQQSAIMNRFNTISNTVTQLMGTVQSAWDEPQTTEMTDPPNEQ